ncbi:MAG: carbohydrate ABC transporter permease [Halanaerobiaceae bacterium]|jgi:multiple sugar transport system permease protein|nr:carbohydrate ABC transporter permease [Halanaerobiaceae bacterium]
MISSSFKTSLEIQGMKPTWIPQTFTLDNYKEMNKTVPIFSYFKNSLIVSGGTMIFSLILSTLAAYGISRFRFRGRNLYVVILMATQMLPGILFVIPYFMLFTWIKNTFGIPMTNTFHGLIFTYTSFALPFSILMLRNYLDSVPKSIDEQALIDGCTRFQALYKIIIPLAKPGLAAMGIYSFIMGWNEILFATILTSTKTKTIALGLLQYITQNQARWGQMMAACIIASLPIIIIFTSYQKHIVQGLVAGATKG